MTLALIEQIFRSHPSQINPGVLVNMWHTVMLLDGGKMRVLNV